MLSIFVDSSSGHRNLALKHRILHRDVSTGIKTGQMVGGAPFKDTLDEYATGMEVLRPLTEGWR